MMPRRVSWSDGPTVATAKPHLDHTDDALALAERSSPPCRHCHSRTDRATMGSVEGPGGGNTARPSGPAVCMASKGRLMTTVKPGEGGTTRGEKTNASMLLGCPLCRSHHRRRCRRRFYRDTSSDNRRYTLGTWSYQPRARRGSSTRPPYDRWTARLCCAQSDRGRMASLAMYTGRTMTRAANRAFVSRWIVPEVPRHCK